MSRPILVFGVSGATWEVVAPLVASGRMPHLARLIAAGAEGTLESVRAPGDHHYRPQVAWATMATGCTPERHGVTAFFHEAEDLVVPTLWERFDAVRRTVGVFGWPGTWPPKPIRGFVVPSHLARDTRTWPPDLAPIKDLDRLNQGASRTGLARRRTRAAGKLMQVAVRHRVGPATGARIATAIGRAAWTDGAERPLLLRRAKLDLTADVFVNLCSTFAPDLRAFVTFYADFVLHRYWRYREPERFGIEPGPTRLASAVDRAFEDVDRALGRILASTPRTTSVAVVSEHGMKGEVDSAEVGPAYFGIRGEEVLDLVGHGGAARVCPVARWVAYRSPPDDLAERLRGVRVEETGLPLFAVYEHGSDEVVVKFSLSRDVPAYEEGPLDRLNVVHGSRRVAFTDVARRLTARRSAMHDRDGIIVVAGPAIAHRSLGRVRLMDLAPTLLQVAGLPVPADVDGRALDLSEP